MAIWQCVHCIDSIYIYAQLKTHLTPRKAEKGMPFDGSQFINSLNKIAISDKADAYSDKNPPNPLYSQ
jgi:hypothetical protein